MDHSTPDGSKELRRLLREFSNNLSSPPRKYISPPATATKDVQYFKKVKARTIFRAPQPSAVKTTKSIDPYSRADLLSRIQSFNSLNWYIPGTKAQKEVYDLTELKCARNGWKCITFSSGQGDKNHLLCTSCSRQLVLRIDPISSCDLAYESQNDLETILKIHYYKQICSEAHAIECPWRDFETPLEDVYYLRPYVDSTSKEMLQHYLKSMNVFINNLSVLKEVLDDAFDENFIDFKLDETFREMSNKWLVRRYFKDNKENSMQLLSTAPQTIYKLALFGWGLKVQPVMNQFTLLLVCSMCNMRTFLKTDSVTEDMDISISNILTPCKVVPAAKEYHVDPINDHHPWCCVRNKMFSKSSENLNYVDYLQWMMVHSESNMGENGEFVDEK